MAKPRKGVVPPHLRKYLFKKGHRPVKKGGRRAATSSPGRSRRRAAAPRKRSRTRAAVSSFHGRAKGFIANLTPAKLGQIALVADGLQEGLANSKRSYGADPLRKVLHVVGPMVDGGLAAKALGKAAHSSVTAPGLVGDLATYRFAGGGMPSITPQRVLNAAPSLIGWAEGFRRFREERKRLGGFGDYNLLPRLSAMTGVRVRNAHAVGGPWLEGAGGANQPLRDGVIGSAGAPVVVGGLASKVIAKVVHL